MCQRYHSGVDYFVYSPDIMFRATKSTNSQVIKITEPLQITARILIVAQGLPWSRIVVFGGNVNARREMLALTSQGYFNIQ